MPQRLSRRAALSRILKAGGGLLAAGTAGYAAIRLATDEDAPAQPSLLSARSSTPALPSLASTAARATATPSPTPPPPREVRLRLIPTAMHIPALGIDAPVEPAQLAPGSGGQELLIPDHGVVSPNHVLGDHAINNVWILGHSRWHRVPQLLYTLANLNPGDTIRVDARDQARDRELPALTFEVDRLILADTELAGREIYVPTPDRPRLILQTSVRQTYDPEWILDRATLEAKADVAVATSVDDLSRYLLLLVTAELSEDTFASLLANA